MSSFQKRLLKAGRDMTSPPSHEGMSRDMLEFTFRYFHVSYDCNSTPDKADGNNHNNDNDNGNDNDKENDINNKW